MIDIVERYRSMEETVKLVKDELTEMLYRYKLKDIGYDLYHKHVDYEFKRILNIYKADKSICEYSLTMPTSDDDPFKVMVNLYHNHHDLPYQIELVVYKSMEETVKLVKNELVEALGKYKLKDIGYDLYYKHVDYEFKRILNIYKADKSICEYSLTMPPSDDPFKVMVNLYHNHHDLPYQIELVV